MQSTDRTRARPLALHRRHVVTSLALFAPALLSTRLILARTAAAHRCCFCYVPRCQLRFFFSSAPRFSSLRVSGRRVISFTYKRSSVIFCRRSSPIVCVYMRAIPPPPPLSDSSPCLPGVCLYCPTFALVNFETDNLCR